MALLEVIIVCLLMGLAAMYIKTQKMKKDIYSFTDKLEEVLDTIISRKEIPVRDESGDLLWDKICAKLLKIEHIFKKREEENIREKRQIKELISDISHQTKTPVANIKIYLEILENEKEDPGKRTAFLGKIKGQKEKLEFLLESMVKMSRLETGVIEIHKQEESIYETLRQAVAAIVPKAGKKKISIHVDCDEQLTVSHDKKWTEEAIFNILDNAVKYTDEKNPPRMRNINIKVIRQELFTQISIRDSGKGIASLRQAEIFKRFYREPEVHDQEGIGVGLYLARKIITMQDGYIDVCSEEGEGAEFRIFLPNNR